MDCFIQDCDTILESKDHQGFNEGPTNFVVQGMTILFWFKGTLLSFNQSKFISMKLQFGLFSLKSVAPRGKHPNLGFQVFLESFYHMECKNNRKNFEKIIQFFMFHPIIQIYLHIQIHLVHMYIREKKTITQKVTLVVLCYNLKWKGNL